MAEQFTYIKPKKIKGKDGKECMHIVRWHSFFLYTKRLFISLAWIVGMLWGNIPFTRLSARQCLVIDEAELKPAQQSAMHWMGWDCKSQCQKGNGAHPLNNIILSSITCEAKRIHRLAIQQPAGLEVKQMLCKVKVIREVKINPCTNLITELDSLQVKQIYTIVAR